MASTSSARRSFPTLRYAFAPFRWLFGSRQRVLTAAVVLLAMIAAPVIWWSIQLLGLPDIGDPFDVQEFRSFTIPDDRNALVLYRQAADRLQPITAMGEIGPKPIDLGVRWVNAHPLARRWLEANRAPLELFRRGSERPDALDPQEEPSPDPRRRTALPLRSLHDLAMLEASRLEEAGDMAGAWTWYRAALRGNRHLRLRATILERMMLRDGALPARISAWADDDRTTPAMIRRALEDVVACGDLVPSDVYTLKLEYLSLEQTLAEPHPPGLAALMGSINARLQARGYQLDLDKKRAILRAWWFWRREAERSRRVVRLALANWLAYYEMPPSRRPAADPGVSGYRDFYAFGPDAPENARALSPAALDRWLRTTYDAEQILRIWDLRTIRMKEQADHRALVVLLASELYRRDHGKDPATEEALVGPYLKSLADDGSQEPAPRWAAEPEGSR